MIDYTIVESDSKGFENAMSAEMEKPIAHLERELVTIRTGRAHTSMVEDVKINCYGSEMRLKEVAAISAPDVRLIVIQPWDKTVITDIEKGIQNSHLGVTPLNDGEIIRIQLPEISADRREELIKVLHKKLEECRVAIRNVRKEFQNLTRDSKKKKTISEDFANRLDDCLKKVTDRFIKTAEEMSKKKETEVRGV